VRQNFASHRRLDRGLTLLEVMIALMLFSLMSTILLSGQGTATRSIEKAEAMRAMAELLSFRLNMVVLQPKDYEDGERGTFPESSKSSRLVDEDEIFGDRYEGYTWEVTIAETIGAGSSGSVSIEGEEPRNALFSEEGSGSGAEGDDGGEEEEVEADQVDRMMLITVTVYPPNYDEADADDPEAIKPRSVWTAIHLPEEESEGGPGPDSGPGSAG
jgi:prepilin-type N-terminal cleavage/methylation domain-containing protein